jgi:thiamine-monophosphate kinase
VRVTHETTLGPGAEFDAIRAMLARWGALAEGVGDDAAMLRLPRGETLVVSTDSTIEQRHFRREWLTPREIGYRAVTAALSDIAAMAATPIGVLIALGVPDDWRASLDDLCDGIGEAVGGAHTVIRGGNVARANELSITTTVLGSAFAPLRRSGARPGDAIYVTGALGAPAAALRAWMSGADPGEHRARFARPVARLHEARVLALRGATAAIDVSDGLVADARHLAAASGAVVEIVSARVPRASGAQLADALAGGEEYELLIAAQSGLDTAAFSRDLGIPLTEIGVVRQRSDDPHVLVDGKRVADVVGHDHFSR